MFRGATNPYDEIVVKATDENQTSENWEILLNLCDKVSEEGEQGARNVIAALLKRLTHRNANVQLYSLAVAEALSKNCGIEVHREIASRAFTQGLEKLVTDRTGHDKVKKKALTLIDGWDKEWADDPSLSIMHELHEGLKGKGFRFDQPAEEPPPDDAAIRRREEEELQRVLELSMQDKGGRSWGGGYAPQPSVGGSSSSKDYGTTEAATSSSSRPQAAKPEPQQPTAGGYAASAQRRAVDIVHQAPLGYSASASSSTTASEPSYAATSSRPPASSHTPVTAAVAPTPASQPVPATTASPAPIPDLATATRVRALHNFEPADAGELAFEKGDVIKVIDRTHKDWWKGQLKGRTGIFPVNYVEALPEPTSADLAREAEAEAAVFAQAANIDKLLNLLRGFDINKDNLADDENIQELYRSSMGVRPKIIRLIEKYNQKKVELAMMNDNFVSAKDLFDRMMEESLARHNPNAFDMRRHTSARPPVNGDYRWGGQYPQQPGPPPPQGFYPQQPGPQYGPFPQDAAQASYPPQIYPPQQQIDPAAYAAQQAFAGQDPNAYQAQQIQQQPIQQPQGYDPNVYTAQMQGQSAQPAQAPLQQQPQGYDPAQYQAQAQPAAATQPATAYNQNAFGQQQYQQPTQPTQAPSANANVPVTGTQQPAYDPNSYNAQYAGQPAGQSAAAGVPSSTEQQPATQPQEPTQQQQGQPAQGIQPAAGDTPKVFTGTPPYPFDPTAQYPDANAQAWAQYYAAGGDDPQGAVYFISVPGVKEAAPATSPPAGNADPSQYGVATQQTQQQQQQHHATDAYSTQQLSPKSPTGQLKASPKSNRLSMAGVGTVAQHPHLQSSLPTYAHEQAQGKRPSSAGSGSAAASSWPHQQHQATAVGATSPGGAGPWNPQNPHIVEPARTDSTSPPGGYRPYYGGMSPGGQFVPASAGPQTHSNQATPYPTHPSPRSQQLQLLKGAPQ